MYRTLLRKTGIAGIAASCALVLSLVALMGSAQAQAAIPVSVVASASYTVDVFAKGTASYLNPDSVDVADGFVFIGYQNITAKDGTDHKSSTIVQYTLDGKVVHTFSVPGHCDGMRFNKETDLLWATSNEDGNPGIVTIDPESGKITPYIFPTTPHGGGYDDVIFLRGKAFIAASNPTLNSAGVNVFPAVDEITLKDGKAVLTPILQGNATAVDTTTGKTVTLNLTDPDSLMIDTKGNLVLDDQADSQIVTIRNPGTDDQKVTTLPVTTQLDDSWWIRSGDGALLLVDGKANTTYKVTLKGDFEHGTIYTVVPSDSTPLPGTLGIVDSKTGKVTPVVTGLGSPTGLNFLPE
jgi:hypothetical protein